VPLSSTPPLLTHLLLLMTVYPPSRQSRRTPMGTLKPPKQRQPLL
jgi:hypothetical protein